MGENYFNFKEFTIWQHQVGMRVTTDSCLFGAWVAAQEANASGQALDIGTGTGLLSCMLAQKTKYIIKAVEIDATAYQQATENIKQSKYHERITIIHQNILNYTPSTKFDTIICNPPFFKNDLVGNDPNKNLALHENNLGLQDLFNWVNNNLTTNGKFYLLNHSKRHQEVITAATSCGLFCHKIIAIHQTLKHDSFRHFYCFTKNETSLVEQNLIIKHYDKYTPEAITLLKDYYLFL
jgi:tRNA1Val (adenine37-N6)-methyltransferase